MLQIFVALIHHNQQLQLQLQTIQEQNADLQHRILARDEEHFTSLEQQTSEAFLSSLRIAEPKVTPPDVFVGDRKKSRAFLLQLKVVFSSQPSRFTTDKSKFSMLLIYSVERHSIG